MKTTRMQVVFVSGLAGSGKTTTMAALEDLGFYSVDRLPVALVEPFLRLCETSDPPIHKVALAVDAWAEQFLVGFGQLTESLRAAGSQINVIFLDCSDPVLLNRYRETRRVHPFSPEGTVEQGIAAERQRLVEVERLADFRIDTSLLNVHELKETIVRHLGEKAHRTQVRLLSFGYRYGLPTDTDLVFDVRFLPNPYFVEELRAYSGAEPAVAKYVCSETRAQGFFEHLQRLLDFLLHLYDREGKAYLTIGMVCTGGRHRSVAMTNALA